MAVGELIFGGLTSLFSSLFNGIIQHNENLAQQDFQRNMFHEATQYNTTMWNMTNEYNNPRNQLNRLLQTGMNPNAAFAALGGQSASTPVTPAVPSASSTGSTAGVMVNGFSAVASALASIAQVQNLEQDAKGKSLDNLMKQMDIDKYEDFQDMRLNEYEANIMETLNNARLVGLNADKTAWEIGEMLPILKEKTIEERKKISQEIVNLGQEFRNMFRQGQLLEIQGHNEIIKGQNMQKEGRNLDITNQQLYYATKSAKYKAIVDDVDARFAEETGIHLGSDVIDLIMQLSVLPENEQSDFVSKLSKAITGVAPEVAEMQLLKDSSGIVGDVMKFLKQPQRGLKQMPRTIPKK